MTALFTLSGKVLRFRRERASHSLPVEEMMQSVLRAHTKSKELNDEVGWCVFDCSRKGETPALLTMIVENLVDLFSMLVARMAFNSHFPEQGGAVVVHVGGILVENQAERDMILSLLVDERLKTLIDLATACKERLDTTATTEDSGARLQTVIHDLELLRKRQERK